MRNLLILAVVILLAGCGKTQTVADLPLANCPRTLADVKSGDVAWTIPQAMWVDRTGQLFINDRYAVEPVNSPDCIVLTRHDEGFDVDLHGTNFRWQRLETRGSAGASGECTSVLKVFDSTKVEATTQK